MSTAIKLPPSATPKPGLKQVFNTSKIQRYKPAPMGKRIIAMILDFIISGAISQLITAFGIKVLVQDVLMQSLVGVGVGIGISGLYWIYLPLKWEGTPGKKLMGLRIVTEKHSRKLTGWMMVKREGFGKFLSAIVLGLGYLSAFGDKKERRTWHDRLAKTRVIEYR